MANVKAPTTGQQVLFRGCLYHCGINLICREIATVIVMLTVNKDLPGGVTPAEYLKASVALFFRWWHVFCQCGEW